MDIRLKFTLQETVQHKQVVQLERLFTKNVEKIVSLWDLMVEFPRNFWLGNNRKISQFNQSLVCHQHTFCSAEMHVHVASAGTVLTVSSTSAAGLTSAKYT